jgi:hypothetical protein
MAQRPPEPMVREREEPQEEEEYRYYPPPTQPERTSALALASLSTGIAAWFVFPLIGAITAVITGFLAQDEIRRSEGRLRGSAFATAGLVLGWLQIGLILLGVLIGLFIVGAAFRVDGTISGLAGMLLP